MKCPECNGKIIEKEVIGINEELRSMEECANCGQPIDEKVFSVKIEKEVKATDRNKAIRKFVNRITYESDEVEVKEATETDKAEVITDIVLDYVISGGGEIMEENLEELRKEIREEVKNEAR